MFVEVQTTDLNRTRCTLIHILGFLSNYINLRLNNTFLERLNSAAKSEFSRKCIHPVLFMSSLPTSWFTVVSLLTFVNAFVCAKSNSYKKQKPTKNARALRRNNSSLSESNRAKWPAIKSLTDQKQYHLFEIENSLTVVKI